MLDKSFKKIHYKFKIEKFENIKTILNKREGRKKNL